MSLLVIADTKLIKTEKLSYTDYELLYKETNRVFRAYVLS